MAKHRNSPQILQLLMLLVEYSVIDATETFFYREPFDVKQVLPFGSSTLYTYTLPCGVGNLKTGKKVAWYKNGRQISIDDTVENNFNGRDRYIVDVSKTSLQATFNLRVTTSVHSAAMDSGNYQCKVMTTPPLESRKARVDVFVAPKYDYVRCSIGDYPNDVSDVNEGMQIKLSCRSDPTGVPEMITYWTRTGPQGDTFDTVNSTSTDSRDGSRVRSFSWTPTNQENGATFTCTGFHPGYSTAKTSQLGPFNVLYRPVILLFPTFLTLKMETQVVTFTCRSDANPPVTRYTWSHTAGKKFSLQGDNVKVGPGGMWMQMKHFDSQDNGVYNVTCDAVNEVGRPRVKSTSTLTVRIQNVPSDGQHDMTSVTHIGTSSSYNYGINTTVKSGQTKTTVIIGSVVAGCGFIFAVIGLILVTVCVCKSRKNSPRRKSADTRTDVNTDKDTTNVTSACIDSSSVEVTVKTQMSFENTDVNREDSMQSLVEPGLVVRFGKQGTTISPIAAHKTNNAKTDTWNEITLIHKNIDQRSEKGPVIFLKPNQHIKSDARSFSPTNASINEKPLSIGNNTEKTATTELKGQSSCKKLNHGEADISSLYATVDLSKK